MQRLTLTAVPGIPTVMAGMDLASVIADALAAARIAAADGDIFVVAQKIVSKSEGRAVRLQDVTPSPEAVRLADTAQKDARLVELILSEAREVLRCRPGLIIVEHRLGYVIANAGIDASNVEGDGGETVLLLPENPDGSARTLRQALHSRLNADIGVIINDSFGRAWRLGTVGTAIGVAGLPGLLDMRGTEDRGGRRLLTTEVAVADELAAAASLLMGQAAENQPVIHVQGFRAARDGSAKELVRPRQQDLFR
jgi:coenzyme F420-0:L-glutamate ligase/coenzyme F420-1:gamma-L-glutamate ligase